MEDYKIGIVTVLYNSESVLEDFFSSLESQNYTNFVLYIIDNASSDASVPLVKKLMRDASFPTNLICNAINMGVARGNNQGIELAVQDKCDYILLSNNDVVLDSGCIRNLLMACIDNHKKIIVPKIYFYNSNRLWYAGGSFVDFKGNVAHWGYLKEDTTKYDIVKTVDYAPTCVALLHTSVFTEVGLFDENYFVYYDDTDFMRRLKRNKIEVLYFPQAFLWHKESMSTGGMRSDFSVYYMARNQIYFVLKFFDFGKCFFFFLYLILHLVFRKIFILSFRQLKILFQGYKDGVLLYKNFLMKK